MTVEQDALRFREFAKGLPITIKTKKAVIVYGPNPEKDFREAMCTALDQRISLAPTAQQTLATEYSLNSSEYLLTEILKFRRGDVSVKDFMHLLGLVVHSHHSNKFKAKERE